MSDIPNWDTVTPEIRPIAKDYLKEAQDTFEKAGYDVSDIGETNPSGGIGWDFTIINDDGDTIVISFEVVDSLEYEGEMLGYNVSLDAVKEDGGILVKHAPHNYTDKVWTTDLDELTNRAETMPAITPNDLN